jgi:translation initiation factor IF-3
LDIMTRALARNVPRVRLIGDGSNEIVPTEMAIRKAEDAGLDLVIVSDQSDPPVVRIQDFKKIEYEKKKAKQTKTRTSEVKEIQLKVNISDHDLQTKMSAIRRFLERGDKVKLTVRLKGREREAPERASALIKRVAEQVQCMVSRVPGPMTIAILEQAAAAKDSPAARPAAPRPASTSPSASSTSSSSSASSSAPQASSAAASAPAAASAKSSGS